MKSIEIDDKFPKIIILKITNGFLVGIFPENKDVQKMMQAYVKQIMDVMTNMQSLDGDEWKSKMQRQIDLAMQGGDDIDAVKFYWCKDELEAMSYIAPIPEGDVRKPGRPDLSWFWAARTLL